MGKRGPKPKRIISEYWSSNLAYAVGLLVTDGCLLPGHGIDFTSKDREQVGNLKRCLGIKNKIGEKQNGRGDVCFRVQFRSVFFYVFLLSVGLMPNKSRIIGPVNIPRKYFFDFLRGLFDGDGSIYSYWDKRWRSSFMFYVIFASASKNFVYWLRKQVEEYTGCKGHISEDKKGITLQLKYAKLESVKILKKMYYSRDVVCLKRKRLKVKRVLGIVNMYL